MGKGGLAAVNLMQHPPTWRAGAMNPHPLARSFPGEQCETSTMKSFARWKLPANTRMPPILLSAAATRSPALDFLGGVFWSTSSPPISSTAMLERDLPRTDPPMIAVFILGLFVGANAGLLVAALLRAAADADHRPGAHQLRRF